MESYHLIQTARSALGRKNINGFEARLIAILEDEGNQSYEHGLAVEDACHALRLLRKRISQNTIERILNCDHYNRIEFLRLLASLGKDAKPCLPILIEIIRESNSYLTKREAVIAVGKIGIWTQELQSALHWAYDNAPIAGYPPVIIRALGGIKVKTKWFALAVEKAIASPYSTYRSAGVDAAANCGFPATT